MKHTPRELKNQAKLIKQNNPALKLTKIQHSLAKKDGYKSFQALLSSYGKEYKTHNIHFIVECKSRLFDNYTKVINAFESLSYAYEKSEESRIYMLNIDESNSELYKEAEEVYEQSEEKYLNIISQIGQLVINHNNYYVQYQPSIDHPDLRLVFSLYFDYQTMVNSYDGSNADYTVVINGASQDIELYIDDDMDGYYYDFPKL